MNPETQRMTELEELLIDAEADDDTSPAGASAVRRPWLLLLGLVLVALNLRPALSSMAPLLSDVSSSLGLSAAKAGLLTTLPVLCLGLFAPLAPILARRFGAERVVLGILLTLAAGIVLRSSLGESGCSSAAWSPARASASSACCCRASSSVTSPAGRGHDRGLHHGPVPGRGAGGGFHGAAEHAFGDSWAIGLGFWMLPALVAALCWWPQVGEKHGAHQVAYRVKGCCVIRWPGR
jgi:CP family cyanate transporter-like MFS transporter